MTAQNLKSHTYCATLPDGRVIKRKTTRVYTHVVVVCTPTYVAAKGQEINNPRTWGHVGWCGRLDLAEKMRDKNKIWHARDENGKLVPYDTQAQCIPVDNPRE